MNYKELNDYELLNMVYENEAASDALYKKYEPLINKIAKKMYQKNNGIEFNDLIQEGNIGLSHAIKYYDQNKNILFFTYAKLCIEKAMLSYIVGTKRQKHKILNESISMEAIDEKEALNSLDKIVASKEDKTQKYSMLKDKLTDLELMVLDMRYYGFEYKEIAKLLGKDVKAIDNAVQRIKYKAKKLK